MASPTTTPPEILTCQEVAAELRCSTANIYNLLNGTVPGADKLPSIQMGRRKLIRRSALEAWKTAHEGR